MMLSPSATALPTLFLSHGSPELANDPGPTGAAFTALGQALVAAWTANPALKPRAVLVVSPHWSTREPAVSTRTPQTAWHDFGGFAPELYTLAYAPAGAPAVAEELLTLLQGLGLPARGDADRPLDHGAWVPLRYLLPLADVPVLQLSLQPFWSPAQQFALGQQLATLRKPRSTANGATEEGVLIFASGSFTHNLQEGFGMMQQGVPHHSPAGLVAPVQPYVEAFRSWFIAEMHKAVAAYPSAGLEAFATLFDYRRQAPHAARAHPTDEHFIPIYIALGAAVGAGDAAHTVKVTQITDEVTYGGVLAMDSFAFENLAA